MLVEQMTVRISASNARIGTYSAQACSYNRMLAGYCVPHACANAVKRSLAAASVAAL
ncbi:hypothetical protein O7631_18245 [Micromonospora sp. WMMD967]|uniref:hypothetical protein n=1 Tax=Micromonospora sp. WMMD967 TaxID=3016101 RepID=UPI002417D7F3|nr:hypothetical protein [Micromonospora sp. WMMD967]MDG4838460.1 hypothetical protein [Micromonospora sp. WMMD967]